MAFSAIVTGGASGIGEALARKLATRGVNVLIADMQVERGTRLAKDLSSAHEIDAAFHQVDVSKEDSIKNMVHDAVKRWGRLDYAANCAGICETIWDEEESISAELFDRTFTINTRGVWLCQKHQAIQMKKQEPRAVEIQPASRFPIPPQRGSIVNICSISGLHAKGLAAYTASKYGAVGVTKNGAKFYGPFGIRVNGLCPGWTMTPMIEESMGKDGVEGSEESKNSPVTKEISLRRMAFAQEQANVLSFLLSPESSYVNGSLIVSDGGYHDIR